MAGKARTWGDHGWDVTLDASLRHCDDRIEAGDIDGALAALTALAGPRPLWSPGLAWRIGLVHYLLRGSPKDALSCLSRGVLGDEQTADEALLLGWLSVACWAQGDSRPAPSTPSGGRGRRVQPR